MKDDEKQVEQTDVEILRAQNAAMLERINRLENPGVPIRQKKVTEHVGHLRSWEGGMCIRVGKTKENYELPETNPKRLLLDIVTVDAKGKETAKTVNYLEFITHAPKVKVKFLKLEREERPETDPEKGGGGFGNKHAIDTQGRSTPNPTGEEIALEVVYLDITAEVEVLEGDFKGKTFSFNAQEINALNI